MSKGSAIIIGVLLGFALVAAAWVIAGGFDRIAKADRTVTVRGLAEREVDADLALWRLSYELGGDSLGDLQNDIIKKNAAIVEYLKKYGLTEGDYTILAPAITDRTLEYAYDSERSKFKFVGNSSILVRSNNVQSVKKASENTIELMNHDIALSQNYEGIRYEYTALNSIKPEMIGEATKSARSSATQFAQDSGSSVGKIKNATQGYFSIDDAAPGLEYKKKVRVVTTVEYVLND